MSEVALILQNWQPSQLQPDIIRDEFIENWRERKLAELTAACLRMSEADIREVEFYAAYLRTRRGK